MHCHSIHIRYMLHNCSDCTVSSNCYYILFNHENNQTHIFFYWSDSAAISSCGDGSHTGRSRSFCFILSSCALHKPSAKSHKFDMFRIIASCASTYNFNVNSSQNWLIFSSPLSSNLAQDDKIKSFEKLNVKEIRSEHLREKLVDEYPARGTRRCRRGLAGAWSPMKRRRGMQVLTLHRLRPCALFHCRQSVWQKFPPADLFQIPFPQLQQSPFPPFTAVLPLHRRIRRRRGRLFAGALLAPVDEPIVVY